MRVELVEDDIGFEFVLEPETIVEKCALEYLAHRPRNEIRIQNTRLGIFKRKEEEI